MKRHMKLIYRILRHVEEANTLDGIDPPELTDYSTPQVVYHLKFRGSK